MTFDKGGLVSPQHPKNKGERNLKEDGIVLFERHKVFDIIETLKILEYAINNWHEINEHQEEFEIKQFGRVDKFTGFSPKKLNRIISKKLSRTLKEVISEKIPRPEKNFEPNEKGITYYWQDGLFHITFKGRDDSLRVVKKLKNIYFFERDYHEVFVFDTDSTFYYVPSYFDDYLFKKMISKKHRIVNTKGHHETYTIKSIGRYNYSINFYQSTNDDGIQPKSRTLIYSAERDILIQNLDKLLSEKLEK